MAINKTINLFTQTQLKVLILNCRVIMYKHKINNKVYNNNELGSSKLENGNAETNVMFK